MYKWYSFDYFLDSMVRLGFESIALWGGPPHFNVTIFLIRTVEILTER